MLIFYSTHASWGEPHVAGRWLAFDYSPKTAALKGTCDGVIFMLQDQTEKNLLLVCSEPIHMKCQFCLLSVQLSHAYLMSWLILLVCHCTAAFKTVEPVVNSRFLKTCTPPTTVGVKEVSTADFSSLNKNLTFTCCSTWDTALSVSGTCLQHR